MLEILDANGVSSQYSTVKSINDKVMNPLSPPLFSVTEEDKNGDGKNDFFQIKVTFKNDPRLLRKVRLLSVIDFELRDKLKLRMQSILDLQADTPEGASKIISSGEVVFEQDKNILIDSIHRTLHDRDPLTAINWEEYSVNEIVAKHDERSERLHLDATTMVQPMGTAFSTTIEMLTSIPKTQEVRYRPGVLETLKFAWV